ncbi:uncharacterized protein TNCV_4604841 [Trichonephila clavipes]|nr:uncharacterized protein TNCV_4604841 [Trichonephila clavipes]
MELTTEQERDFARLRDRCFGTDIHSLVTSSSSSLRLPKIQFQPFSRELRDWLRFHNQFKIIHEDESIDDGNKFQYLIQATTSKSRPRDIVGSFPATPENYRKAFEYMKMRFGQDDVLIQVYVRELLKLVLQNTEVKKVNFSSLFDNIDVQLRDLEFLEPPKKNMLTCCSHWWNPVFPLKFSAPGRDTLAIHQMNQIIKKSIRGLDMFKPFGNSLGKDSELSPRPTKRANAALPEIKTLNGTVPPIIGSATPSCFLLTKFKYQNFVLAQFCGHGRLVVKDFQSICGPTLYNRIPVSVGVLSVNVLEISHSAGRPGQHAERHAAARCHLLQYKWDADHERDANQPNLTRVQWATYPANKQAKEEVACVGLDISLEQSFQNVDMHYPADR